MTLSPRYYALILADGVQCMQIISNAIRHDRRLLRYIEAGSSAHHDDAAHLDPLLADLEREIEDERCSAAAFVVGIDAAGPALDITKFLAQRARVAAQVERVFQRAGIVQQELRALADAAAPDLMRQWSRLETSDHFLARVVGEMAHCSAGRLAQWLRPRLQGVEYATHISIRLGHRTRIAISSKCVGHDLHLFLTIPSWMLYMPRYLPTIAHEVAHPFTERLEDDPVFQGRRRDTTKLISRLCHAYFGPQRYDYSGFAEGLLIETICDVLALHVVGCAYLPALALMWTGATPAPRDPRALRDAAPLSVRLRVLLAELDRLPVRGVDQRLSNLRADIAGQVDSFLRWRAAHCPDSVAFQDQLYHVVRGFVVDFIDSLPAAQPPCSSVTDALPLRQVPGLDASPGGRAPAIGPPARSHCAYCYVPDDIWQRVDEQYRASPDLVATLQRMPEGLMLYGSHPTLRASRLQFVRGDVWELELMQLRFTERPALADELNDIRRLDTFVEQVFAARADDPGFVAVALGPYDLVSLRSGFRVREPDRLQSDPAGMRSYSTRRILVELRQVVDHDGKELHRSTLPPSPPAFRPTAISEIRLRPGATLDDFIRPLHALAVSSDGQVRPLLVFLAVGWNHLTVVWEVQAGSDLQRLHRDLLAPRSTVVERSVTYLTTHARGFGPSRLARTWCNGARWKTSFRILADLRTRDASDILHDTAWLDGQGVVGVQTSTVLGLDDAVASFPVESDADVARVAEILVRASWQGVIGRSMCHLALPDVGMKE